MMTYSFLELKLSQADGGIVSLKLTYSDERLDRTFIIDLLCHQTYAKTFAHELL